MHILYSLLYTAAFLLALPYFLITGLLKRKYFTNLLQRFGRIPIKNEIPSIWIHAVSVGEFLAARNLIKSLQARHPDVPLFVSTTTITGQKLAGEFLPERTFYFPFDWKWCIRKVISRVNPKLILILETEIWPNFLWEAERLKIPVVLINGRISDRSFKRYKVFRGLIPEFSECWMQTGTDAMRMRELGYAENRVHVMGNLKFDYRPAQLSDQLRILLREWKSDSLLIIAGSTMQDEEQVIVRAFISLLADFNLKLLIAPRHPERFPQVEEELKKLDTKFVRRTQNTAFKDEKIMILDTVGELAPAYEFADVVIIGGTLHYGGHNPIEPGYYGKPIVAGPHYENFLAVFEQFLVHEAILISDNLAESFRTLIQDEQLRVKMGEAARALIAENEGATEFVLERIGKWINDRSDLEPDSKSAVR